MYSAFVGFLTHVILKPHENDDCEPLRFQKRSESTFPSSENVSEYGNTGHSRCGSLPRGLLTWSMPLNALPSRPSPLGIIREGRPRARLVVLLTPAKLFAIANIGG